jgi:hypothetical protein
MIRVEFFCTRCNRSAQRRDPGDNPSTGYNVMIHASLRDLHRSGGAAPTGWATDDAGHMICPDCVGAPEPQPINEPRDGWPARVSPFSDSSPT